MDLVYIIDDDEIITYLTNKLLMTEDFCKRVEAFTDVPSALEKLKQSLVTNEEVPDAILFDIDMPIMDGWDFIEEFKKLNVDIPAFVFTFSVNPSDKLRSYQYHEIKDFIAKPITKVKLQKILRLVSV